MIPFKEIIDITEINAIEAAIVIERRIPIGQFFTREGTMFVGIDNSTGDAWTEEFETYDEMLSWQRGLEEELEI